MHAEEQVCETSHEERAIVASHSCMCFSHTLTVHGDIYHSIDIISRMRLRAVYGHQHLRIRSDLMA